MLHNRCTLAEQLDDDMLLDDVPQPTRDTQPAPTHMHAHTKEPYAASRASAKPAAFWSVFIATRPAAHSLVVNPLKSAY